MPQSVRSRRPEPARKELPTWAVVSVIVVVLAVVAVIMARTLFPPPVKVDAAPESEGARWAELMKRTGGQGPVGTRPYAPGGPGMPATGTVGK